MLTFLERFAVQYIKHLISLTFVTLIFTVSPCTQNKAVATDDDKPNIVLISLDTLRADRLGVGGYKRETTPFIDSLAKKGVWFSRSISGSSWTLPAHVSMLTGLLPSAHGVVSADEQKIGSSTKLLAEVLKENGYYTIGLTGAGYMGKFYGFNRGFDSFESLRNGQAARTAPSQVWKRSLELAQSAPQGRPTFMFLHTYDIHCPYAPPEPYFSMFKTTGAVDVETKCGGFHNKVGISPEQAQFLSDRYDGSIRWTDDGLKYFFKEIENRFNSKNTIFIITSDHGEEFLDHGRIGHKNSLYWELIHVPMIIFGKDIKPATIDHSVSTVDIFPTMLSLAKIPYKSPYQLAGASLVTPLENFKIVPPSRKFEVAELHRGAELRAIVDGSFHLIEPMKEGTIKEEERKLYDIEKDRAEKSNLSVSLSEKSKQLNSKALAFLTSLPKLPPNAAPSVRKKMPSAASPQKETVPDDVD